MECRQPRNTRNDATHNLHDRLLSIPSIHLRRTPPAIAASTTAAHAQHNAVSYDSLHTHTHKEKSSNSQLLEAPLLRCGANDSPY